MRIAVVTNWMSCEKTPMEGTFVADLVEELRQQHLVEVIYTPWPKGLPNVIARGIVKASLLRQLHGRGAFDVVHAHGTLGAGEAAMTYMERTGTRYVLTEHACPFSMMTEGYVRRAVAADVLLSASSVIAPSAQQQAAIRDFCGVKVEWVENVVPRAFFELRGQQSHKYAGERTRLLFLGPLTERKGADLLADAIELAPRDPGYQLNVVGDGPLRRRWEKIAHARPDCVTYNRRGRTIPPKFYAEVREIAVGCMRWADAVIAPSRQESFGMVVAEAIAAGRPTVVLGSHPLAGRASFVVPEAPVVLRDVLPVAHQGAIGFGTPTAGILRELHDLYLRACADYVAPPERKLMAEGGV